MLADTCSIDAAISLIPRRSSSVEAAIDSACAGGLVQRRGHLVESRAARRRATAAASSAPPTTSSAIRAMCAAEAVTCSACRATMSRIERPRVRDGRWLLRFRVAMCFLRAAAARPPGIGFGEVAAVRPASSTTISRSPIVAMPSMYCALSPGQRFAGRLDRRRRDRQEFAARVDDQADAARRRSARPAAACAGRTAPARSRSARAG